MYVMSLSSLLCLSLWYNGSRNQVVFKLGYESKTTQFHLEISQSALYASTPFNQNYSFIHPFPPATLLHHFTFIFSPHNTKSPVIVIYQSFYEFSYKKEWQHFPFLQCCPFMAENWPNFRSLTFLSC